MEQAALLLLLVLISLTCFTCDRFAGPYDVDVQQIVRCDNNGTEDFTFTSTRLTKVTRHSVDYYTNFTLKIPVDDNISAVVDMQRWGNGGWRPGFLTVDFQNVCKSKKEFVPGYFEAFMRQTGRDDCPIPAGTYQITMHNMSFLKFDLPQLPYGRYKVVWEGYKDEGKVLIGCIGFISDVIPKRNVVRKKKNRTL